MRSISDAFSTVGLRLAMAGDSGQSQGALMLGSDVLTSSLKTKTKHDGANTGATAKDACPVLYELEHFHTYARRPKRVTPRALSRSQRVIHALHLNKHRRRCRLRAPQHKVRHA